METGRRKRSIENPLKRSSTDRAPEVDTKIDVSKNNTFVRSISPKSNSSNRKQMIDAYLPKTADIAKAKGSSRNNSKSAAVAPLRVRT